MKFLLIKNCKILKICKYYIQTKSPNIATCNSQYDLKRGPHNTGRE